MSSASGYRSRTRSMRIEHERLFAVMRAAGDPDRSGGKRCAQPFARRDGLARRLDVELQIAAHVHRAGAAPSAR